MCSSALRFPLAYLILVSCPRLVPACPRSFHPSPPVRSVSPSLSSSPAFLHVPTGNRFTTSAAIRPWPKSAAGGNLEMD
ncbi:hypothetical protein C8R45DRAFT_92887 [Mycena sanguinolenta]|nr:hypothetical protein C8R45DRAFT_92887 [Mycena sanguinolenta]